MISRFLKDRRGNYAMMMGFAMLPIMGSLAIAVDFSEMNRQKQATINALDAAGIATARQVVTGASDAALIAYANDFFEANLGSVDPDDTELTVVLPNNQSGGGTLKLTAVLNYQPYFLPAFTEPARQGRRGRVPRSALRQRAKSASRTRWKSRWCSTIPDRWTSTAQVQARSASTLLKTAAKQLVDTLAQQAAQIKQVEKPVQFSLVPFAASVNVGPETPARPGWTSRAFRRSITRISTGRRCRTPTRRAEKIGGIWYKKGAGWGEEEGQMLSRFLALPRHEGRHQPRAGRDRQQASCLRRIPRQPHLRRTVTTNTTTIDTYGPLRELAGMRRGPPLSLQCQRRAGPGGSANTGIGFGDPATMFVPMFAPDEPGNHWKVTQDPDEPNPETYNAANSWWNDDTVKLDRAAPGSGT